MNNPRNPSESSIVREIAERVQDELPSLDPHLRIWFEGHRTQPREISVSSDSEGSHTAQVWLVTDDIGYEDGSSRVVYDAALKAFGLVMKLKNGVSWYVGSYDSLVDTIRAI